MIKDKQPNPELIDDENPEWSEQDFQQAKPAKEILPKLFNAELTQKMLQPKSKAISITYSQDVIDKFKASGKGWQERMDIALKNWLKEHDPSSIII